MVQRPVEAMLAVMMGGQTAEGIALGDITTGASNDLQNASNIARKMVTEFGMSDDLGPRTFGAGQDLIFLGKELAQGPNYSDDVASEIEKFLCKARDVATRILEGNRANLTRMAKHLISDETLDGPELQELLANSSPEPMPLAAGRRIGPLVAPLMPVAAWPPLASVCRPLRAVDPLFPQASPRHSLSQR